MKKGFSWIVAASVFAVALAGAAWAEKARSKVKGHPEMCPITIEGAVVQVSNVEKGVKILVTAQDPATIKKIQEAAAGMAQKQDIYVCPMGEYRGPKTKDGRCPKCGMNLQKL